MPELITVCLILMTAVVFGYMETGGQSVLMARCCRYAAEKLGWARRRVFGGGANDDVYAANKLLVKDAVMLALAVGACDGRLGDVEVGFISAWAAKTIASMDMWQDGRQARRKVSRAVRQAAKFISSSERLDIKAICGHIVEASTVSQRYAILELCLRC